MVRRRDYSPADITVVTLREAVLRRPAMYFGDYRPSDWPLVIAAWTAAELLDYQTRPARQVILTLHRGGDLSATAAGARVPCSATGRRWPIGDLVRRRMWWHQLCRSTTVTITRNGTDPGEPQHVGDQVVWDDLSIEVRMALDPDIIGAAPGTWWGDGPARPREVFAAGSFDLVAEDVVVLDEVDDQSITGSQADWPGP
jgi:hypothetical protein